jgi:glycerophosphoryl diester phosphodiesterase
VKTKSPLVRIIGHRGAAGLELENTLASFKHAMALGVDAVEFDVQRTADGEFVVCHDPQLSRVSQNRAVVKELSCSELGAIELHNGQSVPSLRDVLQLCRDRGVAAIVELKIDHHLEQFCTLLDEFAGDDITVASFHHDALEQIRRLRPKLPVYLALRAELPVYPAESISPMAVVRRAQTMGATGLDLSIIVMNPLVYWLARRAKLDIMVYTIDRPLLGRFVSFLYPGVQLCTNRPDRFLGEVTPHTARWRPLLRRLVSQLRKLTVTDFVTPEDQPLER